MLHDPNLNPDGHTPKKHGCHKEATCINLPGSHRCQCNDGWVGDGIQCTALRCPDGFYGKGTECFPLQKNCECKNAKCTGVKAKTGFKLDKVQMKIMDIWTGQYAMKDIITCVDEDECLKASSCDVNGLCTNTQGSFMCKCNKGYSGDGQRGNCKKDICKFNTYGDPSINCRALPPNSECNMNCVSFICQSGYQVKNNRCEDIDECLKPKCHKNGICTNYAGTFSCHCKHGFTGDGLKSGKGCKEIPCDNKGIKAYGSQLDCKALPFGAKLNGNKIQCLEGFKFSKDKSHCVDIDECSNKNLQGKHIKAECTHLCTNSPGGYECHCGLGWIQHFSLFNIAPKCEKLECPGGTKGDWPKCAMCKKGSCG